MRRQSARWPNPDRLTGLDASFLALEDAGAHMHVGSVPAVRGRGARLRRVRRRSSTRGCTSCRATGRSSRSRRSTQARPGVDRRPALQPRYHVRHTALPEPASLEQLRNLAGRVLAQRLDRGKPLWEIWLVDRVEGGALRDDLARPTTAWSTASRASTSRPCCSTSSRTRPAARAAARRGSRGPSRAPPTLVADALAERASDAARRGAGRGRRARPPRADAPSGWRARRLRLRRDAAARACRARRRARYNVRDRPAPALRVGRRRPRPVQGDQGRAGRHGQRRRADRRDGRAAHAHAGQRARRRTASS